MIYTFPFGQEEMLWPCVRLLIAAGETKGYEWAATYLEEGHGILPQPKNIRYPEISMGRLFGSHKTENLFRFFSCPHSFLLFILITRTISVRERVNTLLFTIFGLWIKWSQDQTTAGPTTILAFLPPISGLSVLTGEKTTIPIWKICSDNMIVRPGYKDT